MRKKCEIPLTTKWKVKVLKPFKHEKTIHKMRQYCNDTLLQITIYIKVGKLNIFDMYFDIDLDLYLISLKRQAAQAEGYLTIPRLTSSRARATFLAVCSPS